VKIVVYPHDLDIGGSQLNAIELAAAVQALGHECIVFGRPGSLCARIDELGLEFVAAPEPGRRPSPRVVRALRRLVVERGIDVVHGYEWPPALEAALAVDPLPDVAVVTTVMSMAIAPFIPKWMPLLVGTQQILAAEHIRGRAAAQLMEPPVDLAANRPLPAAEIDAFKRQRGLDDRPVVAVVSRLVPDLKAEGIFSAIELAGDLIDRAPFQLLIVGEGRSRADMEAAATAAHARSGRTSIVFTGELADPRAAYATADVMIGMGGSALRSLAFGKPLIVQGEHGFFRALSPATVDTFRWQGWYGVGAASQDGVATLRAELLPLLDDPALRRERGEFGRRVVEDFSLTTAARHLVTVYRDAVASAPGPKRRLGAAAASGLRIGAYYARRRIQKLRGSRRADDFNAAPVAAASPPRSRPLGEARSDGPILYFAGVRWDTLAGTDRHLVSALAARRPVIWVDTATSLLSLRRHRGPRSSEPQDNVTRLRVFTLPGPQRPILRAVGDRRRARAARRHLRGNGLVPSAVIASTTAPILPLVANLPGRKVFYETDDSVAAGALWGVSSAYLHAAREKNLAAADLVVAVTPQLARHLQRRSEPAQWLPNGAELQRFRDIPRTPAEEVGLAGPVAGVIGQFNARIDLDLLGAVQEAGISLLLVGPRWFETTAENTAFDELIARPGVRWIDAVPREELPRYLGALDVGLTPYRDSMFNRRSYPLKTIEYLAAGIPAVATDIAVVDGLDDRYVRVADRAGFVTAVREALSGDVDRAAIAASVAGHDWNDRADRLLRLIDGDDTVGSR
jgi:glycosyltransferase involved in cell wall biosynthesis